MKARIPLRQTARDPRFVGVARIIARGASPEWLAIGLEHFSGFVGSNRSTSDEYQWGVKVFEQMHEAADLLIKRLPPFSCLPIMECPDDIAIALDVLPRIKQRLAYAKSRGARPYSQRQWCAAVVVEAWALIHDKPEARSKYLYEACNEYWQACGGEYRGGDIENWRDDAKKAATTGNVVIREVLLALRARQDGT